MMQQKAFPLKRNGAWETIPPFRVWAYIQGAMLQFLSHSSGVTLFTTVELKVLVAEFVDDFHVCWNSRQIIHVSIMLFLIVIHDCSKYEPASRILYRLIKTSI